MSTPFYSNSSKLDAERPLKRPRESIFYMFSTAIPSPTNLFLDKELHIKLYYFQEQQRSGNGDFPRINMPAA
jgi:hypothetical protein